MNPSSAGGPAAAGGALGPPAADGGGAGSVEKVCESGVAVQPE